MTLSRAIACISIGIACLSASAAPRQVIVPAVASIHGANGTFFRSELYLFNQSNSRLAIQMTYRCWTGQRCGTPATMMLDPRANRRIDDAVNTLFGAPETAGALEIVFDDAGGLVTARSRMYTTSDCGTFGQEVPGLDITAAHRRSVLHYVPLSMDLRTGMRSNAGAYNPADLPANTKWELHRGDGTLLGTLTRIVGAHEAFQFVGPLTNPFGAAPATDATAYLLVSSDLPIFPYVSAIDNQTGDALFDPGAEDLRPAEVTELLVECSRYQFSPGSGSTPIVLTAGANYRLRFHTTDTTHGLTAIQQLGIGGGDIAPDADYVVDITLGEQLRGSRFNFSCTHICGSGHGNMYGAIEIR
jgi:hypothetical protein